MSTLRLQSGLIYGPVGSRRIGLSLGINISPTDSKHCSFNCVYCHYGWTKVLTLDLRTQPTSIVNLDELAEALEIYDCDCQLLDHITFSGNGEATLHPEFGRAVDIITAFRNRSAPQAKTAILSNSSQVHRPEVRKAILKLDRRLMKIDAGDEAVFRRVNRPPADFRFDAMVSGLKALGDFETQSIFVDGSISNSDDAAVKSWLGVMLELKPKAVQIYTLARPPADSEIKAVSRERMNAIFLQAKKAGLPVTLY